MCFNIHSFNPKVTTLTQHSISVYLGDFQKISFMGEGKETGRHSASINIAQSSPKGEERNGISGSADSASSAQPARKQLYTALHSRPLTLGAGIRDACHHTSNHSTHNLCSL